jgi:hypothetical protein
MELNVPCKSFGHGEYIPSEMCDEFAKLKIVANMEVIEMEVGSSLLQEIREVKWKMRRSKR